MAQPFDPDRLELKGEATVVAEDVIAIRATAVAPISVSESGSLLFQTGGLADVAKRLDLLDADGEKVREVGDEDDYRTLEELGSSFSPDGRQAAVAVIDYDAGTHDIWIFDLQRDSRTRFTFDPAEDFSPVWSPDGKKLAFSRVSTGKIQLFTKDVSGTQDEELRYEADTTGAIPADWSADGTRIAAIRNSPETGRDIWMIPLDGESEPYPFLETRFDESGTFSPDGRFMAVQSNESGEDEVYIVPFPGPGRKWRVSNGGGTSPRWRSDGRVVYYRESSTGRVVANEVDTRGDEVVIGEALPLFEVSGLYARETAWWPSPNGQHFLVARPREEEPRPLTLLTNWTQALRQP